MFPLLYLPSTVSFRFTDILRGYVAQSVINSSSKNWGFFQPTSYQERNDHNLMNDFHLELEYLIENKNVFMLKRKISKIIDNNYLLSKFILIQKKIFLRLKSLIGKND